MNSALSIATAVTALVGTIGGGVWVMEIRYAKAADMTQHVEAHKQEVKNFNLELLETRRQSLRSRIFELEQMAKVRKLTPEEQRYLDETRQLYEDTTEKIRRASQ